MANDFEATWQRYALIAEIVRRFHNKENRLGKTALQKMIFILQQSFGVDVGYNYTLYTYGPYCADVARDLDIVQHFGGAQVLSDPGFGGYVIHPGEANDEIREGAASFLKEMESQLDSLLAGFGSFTAKELELRSTIIYLSEPGLARQELIRQVHDAKPHFSLNIIENAIRELETRGYVTLNAKPRGGG